MTGLIKILLYLFKRKGAFALGTENFFVNEINRNKIFYNIKNKKKYVIMIRYNNSYEIIYLERELDTREQQKIMTYE